MLFYLLVEARHYFGREENLSSKFKSLQNLSYPTPTRYGVPLGGDSRPRSFIHLLACLVTYLLTLTLQILFFIEESNTCEC